MQCRMRGGSSTHGGRAARRARTRRLERSDARSRLWRPSSSMASAILRICHAVSAMMRACSGAPRRTGACSGMPGAPVRRVRCEPAGRTASCAGTCVESSAIGPENMGCRGDVYVACAMRVFSPMRTALRLFVSRSLRSAAGTYASRHGGFFVRGDAIGVRSRASEKAIPASVTVSPRQAATLGDR
jgi:hypothetical protein